MINIESIMDLINDLSNTQKEKILIELIETKTTKGTLNFMIEVLINKSFEDNFNANLFADNKRAKDVLKIIKKIDNSFLEECASGSTLFFSYIPDTTSSYEFNNKYDKTYLSLIKSFDGTIENIKRLKTSFMKDKCDFKEGH